MSFKLHSKILAKFFQSLPLTIVSAHTRCRSSAGDARTRSRGGHRVRGTLTMRITVAALALLVQTARCLASDDSSFMLENKAIGSCLLWRSSRCYTVRWTSGNRLLSPVLKKCLGVQGKSVGSEVALYDCDEQSELQKWECRNETLLALKNQKLYIQMQSKDSAVLSREVTANSHFTVSSTTSGACSRTHRVLYSIQGNAYGRPCMFPFLYKDKWYADCTPYDASKRRPWCAIETKYDHELWGYCPSTSTEYWNKNPVTGAYYQINFQSALTWYQAQASCTQQHAALLSITDPHEQAFVTALLGTDHQRLWIGLSLSQEHGWEWSDGRPFRYLSWNSGHPLPDPGSNCAVADSQQGLYWQSSPCSKKLGYICYREGALPPIIQVEQGFCPSPWIPYNGYCFNLQRAKKTWSEAQTECRKELGDLASIYNTEDKSFILSQLGYSATDELWIGLNDRKTEGLFDWSDHTTVTFTSWEFGEPSTSGSSEDCVLIRGENGNWADRGCEESHGFICMKPSDTTATGREVELDVGCKAGWKRHGSYCYWVGSETKTFDEAKNECKSSDSYLADVSNGVDNAFLVSLVGLRSEKYFWLGLSNQKNIEHFIWDNSNFVKFTHWNAEMPGNRQGCVAITTGIFAGLWDVLPCTNREKYICKHLAEGAVITPIPPTPPAPSCAEKWKPVGSRNTCFKFFTGPRDDEKTWFQARDFCRALGGDLLSIHSALELRLGNYGKAWIGLNAPNRDTGFEWSDGSPLNFQHWEEGEPNNLNDVEYCTEIRIHKSGESGSWNDVHCDSYNDWLCQIRAGVTPHPPPNITTPEYNRMADGWLEWQGNQYYINSNSLSMEDARHYCQQRHGDLVVITSEAENVFLWKQIARQYVPHYIGVTVDLDGTFGWVDGSPVMYRKWAEYQPDFKNNDENCAVMYNSNGFWHDYNCGSEFRSICKRPSSAPINSTAAPTVPPTGGCPLDWSWFDSKCYRIVNSQRDTWIEARRRCIAMGGNLASIVSRHEQAFLVTRMAEAATSDLWIGLNSLRGDHFLWTDGRKRPYSNWGFKRSVHHILGLFYPPWNEDQCVLMSGNSSKVLGKWFVRSCNDTNGYVCLRNVDPKIPAPSKSVPTTYMKVGNDSIKVVMQNMSWSDATKHCEAEGAKLASIRSVWKQAYIELQAVNIKAPLWIGLNKNKTKGYFKFIDGWQLSFVNWATGEPSRDRSCVYVDVDGTWKTAFCNQTLSSVCMTSTDMAPAEPTDYPGVCPDMRNFEYLGYIEMNFAWVPFKGHCYVFVTASLEWPNAASSCYKHGGVLASVEDPFEQEFIKSNIELLRDSQESFWIGLFKSHDGKWLWLDKTVMDYTNWAEDMSGAYSSDYGEIQAEDGTWRAAHHRHNRGYICKTSKVMPEKLLPSFAPLTKEARYRVHTSLAIVLVISIIAVMAVTGFFVYKKSGRPLPTFDNPNYFTRELSQPDVVDTNKLIENVEEDENPEPIVSL
ncbi:macrophage mannose receptor 1b [Lampris incognitus]|uniref:macrophage mannose receptor 1b n=1 Tax=Lampris incognitus TaxID=2546036 RepID=UPI0024B51F9F|nr:macrophage mannose receptor 1b [Lampris incognitus]